MKKIIWIAGVVIALSACSGSKEAEGPAPMDREDQYREGLGKLTGEEGLTILGGKGKDEAGASPIGVNSFLWRATLDTLSFLPLVSADPFGGVIITDWYEDPKTPGERFKVNALILDRTLRADGVKITVFKQKQVGTGWKDQKIDSKLERTLEDTILTRARQLKVSQPSK